MWQSIRISRQVTPELNAAAQELQRLTLGSVMWTVMGTGITWYLAIAMTTNVIVGWHLWLLALLVGTTWLCLRLATHHQLAAALAWLFSNFILVSSIPVVTPAQEPILLLALMPFLAAIMLGGPWSLLAELSVVTALWAISLLGGNVLLPEYDLAIVLGGVCFGVLGWATTYALTTVTAWSLSAYVEAQKYLHATQEQRAELSRMVNTLDRAYYGLERANAALVAARKQAENAERSKAQLVTQLSHELRTPLNLIVGFSEIILTSPESYNNTPLPASYRGDLNAVYHSAQHMLALVDDMLNLARIEVGKIILVREPVDLIMLLAESTRIVRDYIEAKGLTLHLDVAETPPLLEIDALRIRQVLLNLLVNASRFTQRGGITVAVAVRQTEVEVRVTDTGPGISHAEREAVFAEFHSTQSPNTAWHSGTGLGLPISKQFVELHQGRMGVESTIGVGTTFWFTLPTTTTQASRAPQSSVAGWKPYVPLTTRERIVVVVHDDERVVSLLQHTFTGYCVEYVAGLAEGIALANELQAIALLVDEAINEVTISCATPIIRCALPSFRRTGVALGANDLLMKPVTREILLDAIARVATPRRILLADDDLSITRLFRRYLTTSEQLNDIAEAHTGQETLELLRTWQPDLVILDLAMPEGDGYAVLREKAADPALAAIPVIIVSAHAQQHLNVVSHGHIQILAQQGFGLGQILQLVEANLAVLSAGWHQLESTA